MAAEAIDLRGRTVRMSRAGAPVVVGRKLGEGAQGIVHEASIEGKPVALKWLRPGPAEAERRRSIDRLVSRGRPHRAFIWPIDVVEAPDVTGFGYVMPLLERRFVSLAAMLNEPRQPPFRTMIAIGRELVEAFSALHAAGLCYRDINFGNLRIDPATAEVRIIDNDNIGVDGEPTFVKGTLRFMAPEIVRGEAMPSSTTDFYSLAVLLFHLFVHGHPLEGVRAEAAYDWTSGGDEYELAAQHLGWDPLFVFDPDDGSNRPRDTDPMLRWWPIYPRFLRELFERAFTSGMRDPGSPDRFPEGRWRRALGRLSDCISVCPACRAALFWDPDERGSRCWKCGEPLRSPWLLKVHGHEVVLSEGARLTMHHFSHSRDEGVVAAVELHPQRPGEFVMRNMGEHTWTVVPEGEDPKSVAPGQRLAVRPMAIDFGGVHGRIVAGDGA